MFCQVPWYHFGLQCLEQTQLSVRSPYLDNDLVRTVYRAPESALRSNRLSLKLIADGDAALLRIRTDRGVAGNHRGLAAVARRTLLEATKKAEYAYDYGMPHWAARLDSLLSPLGVERVFLGRHKFYHFRSWYRDILAGHVRATLLDRKALSRPYLQGMRAEEIVAAHLDGRQNYTRELHMMQTLEYVNRLFID